MGGGSADGVPRREGFVGTAKCGGGSASAAGCDVAGSTGSNGISRVGGSASGAGAPLVLGKAMPIVVGRSALEAPRAPSNRQARMTGSWQPEGDIRCIMSCEIEKQTHPKMLKLCEV